MKDDGGQAFPRAGVLGDGWEGMSLRDYFAAKVMHAELVTSGAVEESAKALVQSADAAGQTIEQRIAHLAYRMADHMLAERSK